MLPGSDRLPRAYLRRMPIQNCKVAAEDGLGASGGSLFGQMKTGMRR